MSFTDRFIAAETNAEKHDLVAEARRAAITNDPQDYVAVPVPVAVPMSSTIATGGEQTTLQLVWLIGCPGIVGSETDPERTALKMPIHREDVAQDLAFALNQARLTRVMLEQNSQLGEVFDGETGFDEYGQPEDAAETSK